MWFPRSKSSPLPLPPRIFFKNSLSGEKEIFTPAHPGEATMYSCGPTVYGPVHIGNLRSYVFADTVARVLMGAGFHVHRVMNITDVGHLTGDGDRGEDKVAKEARRTGLSPSDIADRYADQFLSDIADMGIDRTQILFPRATEYLKEEIAFAKTLEEKGFTYRTKEGLYFDTSRFPTYGRLAHQEAVTTRRSRVASVAKKNPADFALWRSAGPKDLQQWDSPWGAGNPGWSIECSTMARALLGIEIDIHTGGEDLAATHHNNEIAQSEAANGRRFVRYWLHNAFVTIEGEKISKSLGNVILLSDLEAKGLHPLSLRYFFLQAHYRTPITFTGSAISAAAEALERLWREASVAKHESKGAREASEATSRFLLAVRDDLGTPQALSILWESLKSEELTPEEKWDVLSVADLHFGLSLTAPPKMIEPVPSESLPEEIREMLARREAARKAADFATADALRAEIESRGYRVEDRPEGPLLTRTSA